MLVKEVFSHGAVAFRRRHAFQAAHVVAQLLDGVVAVVEEVLLEEVAKLPTNGKRVRRQTRISKRNFSSALLQFLSYLRWGHYGCRPGGGRPEYKCSLPSGSPARKTWHPSRLSNPPALVSAARHACMNVTGLTSRQKMETYSDSLQQNATPSHVLILQQLLGVFLFLLRERQEKTGKFLQGNVGPVKVHAL